MELRSEMCSILHTAFTVRIIVIISKLKKKYVGFEIAEGKGNND